MVSLLGFVEPNRPGTVVLEAPILNVQLATPPERPRGPSASDTPPSWHSAKPSQDELTWAEGNLKKSAEPMGNGSQSALGRVPTVERGPYSVSKLSKSMDRHQTVLSGHGRQ